MARKKKHVGGSGWTPPNAITTLISLLLVAAGIYMGVSGILRQHGDSIILGMNMNDLFVVLSFVLPGLGWLVMFAGVKSKYL